jgi:hypothetical protein
MSATSKSRLLIFLMIAISLVFFVTSFIAASLSGAPEEQASAVASQVEYSQCMVVRTGEGLLVDCSLS